MITTKRFERDKWLILVVLFIIIYSAIFTCLAILRYRSFFSYEWEDQAIHHQLLWNTAHGKWFYNSIGINGEYFNAHFSPIILFQSLIYRIWPHIYNFFFMISVILSIGALPLYLITKKVLGKPLPAFLISFSYLLYAPLHNINFSDGDPIILTIPLFFFLLLIIKDSFFRFNLRNLLSFFVLCLLALMCKENVGFTIIFLGIYFIIIKKPKWALCCFIPASIGLLISIPIATWLNALTNGTIVEGLGYDSSFELFNILFGRPGEFFLTVFSINHFQYLFKIFKPLIFLPLFSIVSYISITPFAQLMLVKGNIEYSHTYYIAPAIPFLFIGSVHTIKKISYFISTRVFRKSTNNKIILLISFVVLILNIINLFGDNNMVGRVDRVVYDKRFVNATNIFDPVFYVMDGEDKIAWSFISMVPKNASVSATGDLLPALSDRANLKELFWDHYDYLDADYILLHDKYLGFGCAMYCKMGEEEIQRINEIKRSNHWLIVRKEKNFILFKRKQR